jgi:hypothetical protein
MELSICSQQSNIPDRFYDGGSSSDVLLQDILCYENYSAFSSPTSFLSSVLSESRIHVRQRLAPDAVVRRPLYIIKFHFKKTRINGLQYIAVKEVERIYQVRSIVKF